MTIVEPLDERTQTLIDAFCRIRRLRDKTVVVSFNQHVIDDAIALQDALIDIYFMESVGIRPIVVHGPDQALQRALQDGGFDSRDASRESNDHKTIRDVVEKSLAEESNGQLAHEFEQIGGRAMTLNFDSTPVLTGHQIDAANHPEAGPNSCAFGQVTDVDRLVIENLCYAGQVPFIPAMCLTETGQKLLVNSDSAAATVAVQLNAEILVTFAEFPPEFANLTGPNSGRLEWNLLATDGEDVNLNPELKSIIKSCGDAMDSRAGRLMIADTRQRHAMLMHIFTTAGRGIEMAGA